jgi:enoyl-CoA hydratase/carnithine racemase
VSDQQELVLYSVKDQIATITLNRPEKLNAFSDDSVVALLNVMRRFDIDDEARVAVIVGAGRAFSSGADVQQRQLRSKEEFAKHGGPQGWGPTF